jgi:hypothetical protein
VVLRVVVVVVPARVRPFAAFVAANGAAGAKRDFDMGSFKGPKRLSANADAD